MISITFVYNMQLHPFILILLSSVILALANKKNKLFKIITILYPLATAISLFRLKYNALVVNILDFGFKINYDFDSKLISFGLLVATFAANLYSLSINRKIDIILGSVYCFFGHLFLFAGDYISLFIGLEGMMIFASLLLLVQNTPKTLKATKRYFITHLFSGSLILIGISYLITVSESSGITQLIFDYTDSNKTIIYSILLIGCLINIGVFPFSGWVTSCYPSALNGSFIYLITYTTKLSLVLLIKLFSGFFILKYIGIVLIVTSTFYLLFEYNLKRVLCYLTLSGFGYILIGISANNAYLFEYIFIDIIYKALIGLILVILENKEIRLTTELHKLYSYRVHHVIKISIVTCVLMILNFPFITLGAYIKHSITESLSENLIYLIIVCNFVTIYGILSLFFINSQITVKQRLSITSLTKFALHCLLSITLIYNVTSILRKDLTTLDYYMMWQLVLFIFAAISAYYIKPLDRLNTKKYTIDLLKLVYNFFYYVYLSKSYYSMVLPSTNVNITIPVKHDQKAAILIVFVLLILSIYCI